MDLDLEDQVAELITLINQLITVQNKVLDVQERTLKLANLNNERWERLNPKDGDEPIHDWASINLPPGYSVTFYLEVPEGFLYYCDNISANFVRYSTYEIIRDGIAEPTTGEVVCDFGDHWKYFNPPKKIHSIIEITITNNSILTNEYLVFFGGFLRLAEEML